MLLDSLPSCFSNPNNLTSKNNNSNSNKMQQKLVTCIYQTQIFKTPTFLTLTWSKTLSTHSLTINIDSFSLSLSISHSTFSLFRNKPGSKSLSLTHNHTPKLYWDFTRARFSPQSAEPVSGFYLAIADKTHILFLLGDLQEDALRRSGAVSSPQVEPTFLSCREHIFGQRNYAVRARFLGSSHEISIECAGGTLTVKVDGEVCLVVKRLAWKFRGNQRILVGGLDVDFYWDVFNWVFGSSGDAGHGVFVFQVGDGGVLPEMVGPEKKLMRKSFSSSSSTASSPGNMSVLQWSEESSCSSTSSCSSFAGSGGFSLLLYAWRTE
ncbi:uncharacterized protein LOC143845746 [Tasmannia lanceolata]|uniref:uncharacterized protein LOC143845746 n=1 Tax=Tasmannia lanceolata TaxID=3420 RepID=UPI00406313DB